MKSQIQKICKENNISKEEVLMIVDKLFKKKEYQFQELLDRHENTPNKANTSPQAKDKLFKEDFLTQNKK